jgi:hypothetical protein
LNLSIRRYFHNCMWLVVSIAFIIEEIFSDIFIMKA